MFAMLLQRGFNPPAQQKPANPFDNPAVVAGAIIGGCLWLVLVIALLTAFILILVRAMQALQEVRKRNRSMEPGMVWLSFIPLFGVVWIFMVVTKTADALANEFDDRRLRMKGDNGKTLGMTYAILYAVNYAAGVMSACFAPIACVVLIGGLVQIVVGFMYAGKLKAATQRLRNDSGDDGDDFDDDRPDDDGDFDDEPAPRPKPRAKKPREDDDFEEFDEFDPPKKGR